MRKPLYTRNLPLKLRMDGFERVDKKWLPQHKEAWQKGENRCLIDHLRKKAVWDYASPHVSTPLDFA